MLKQNPNSILFLYEGDTEGEFYKRLISLVIPERTIRISYDNLKGISTNINNKVISKIKKHLENNQSEHQIYVFLGIDREGNRTIESPIDISYIEENLLPGRDRIGGINEIIATQDLESWLFIDVDGIYRFLRTSRSNRNTRKYSNYEKFNNKDLAKLFRRNKRVYSKGKKIEGFLESLDLEKIYNECDDLKNGLQKILHLTKY